MTEITLETFHAAHQRAASHGGPVHESNLEAWCSRCNLVLGVYPSNDRSRLLVQHGKNAGQPLPYGDWGYEFAYLIPPEIKGLAPKYQPARSHSEARKRLLDLFGIRWKRQKPKHEGYEKKARTQSAMIDPDGTVSVRGIKPKPGDPREKRERDELQVRRERKQPQRPKGRAHTDQNGKRKGIRRGGLESIPDWRWEREDKIAEDDRRWIGTWSPYEGDCGCLILNRDHPVIVEMIESFQARYPEDMAEAVELEVLEALGEIATAKIAHSAYASEWQITETEISDSLRSGAAITMGMLGLRAETQAVAAMIGGRLQVRRKAAV
jgi:hypothetical protein